MTKEWLQNPNNWALVEALRDGQTLQYLNHHDCWVETDNLECVEDLDHRIKPEPRRVPLTAEDVPPGSVLRNLSSHHSCWHGVVSVLPTSVHIYGESLTFEELFRKWRIRRPGEDWKPCWKETTN